MTYALVQNNEIVSTRLPRIGTLSDGSQVSGFDKLDAETLRTVGWFPVEDPGPPTHDPALKDVNRTLEVGTDKVTAIYVVTDRPPPEPIPDPVASTQEQLDALAARLVAKGTITEAEATAVREPRPTEPAPEPTPR